MKVTQDLKEMAVSINQHRLVSSPKKLVFFFMTPVKTLGVDTVKMAHATGNIAVGSMNQQVIMIRHQTVSGHLKIPAFHCFPKHFNENAIIGRRQENIFSSPVPVYNMIPGSRIFYA
ncbi:hypothetical protein M1M98_03155 [Thermodesulfovibrionales bacterium]|nr:hypothetical protein [Thermodesulfovibrionales bacterium]